MINRMVQALYSIPLQWRDRVPLGLQLAIKQPIQARQLLLWKQQGKPVPPPHIVKVRVLQAYARRSGYQCLVETGTYLGDMVASIKDSFAAVHSVELDNFLAQRATQLFAPYSQVQIHQGDSGKVLPQLLKKLQQPAIFWLDAHYSGGITAKGVQETPIVQELEAIFALSRFDNIIIIDDARHFGVMPDYPQLQEFIAYFQKKHPEYSVRVDNDSIQLWPSRLW